MCKIFLGKKETLYAIVFGLVFGMINILARRLNVSAKPLGADEIIIVVFNTLFWAVIVAKVYIWVKNCLTKPGRGIYSIETENNQWYYFLKCFIVIILCYVPVFLAYYPGIFGYDVATQIPQHMGAYSTHHPLVHTLYLQFFYYFMGEKVLKSYTAGLAAGTLVQIIIFALMLSYIHLFFYRKQVRKGIRIVLLLLSAILPYFSVLSISMTKDVIFSGFVGILFVCLVYWGTEPERYQNRRMKILYIVSIVGTWLFRNNGKYAIIVMVIVGTLYYLFRKKYQFIFYSLLAVLTAVVLSGGLKYGLKAADGSPNEMLSIPYQQIAYVYTMEKDHLSGEEIEMIHRMIPSVENYWEYSADGIKFNAHGGDEFLDFSKLYLKLFLKYPFEYVNAFILNNSGYLYIADVSSANIYGASEETRQGFLLTDTKQGFGVEHISYFIPLETIYEDLFSANRYQEIDALHILCSMAIYFWLVVMMIFYSIELKRKESIIPLSFLIVLLITVLAGPCALIRYALPYIICLPVLFVMVFPNDL